MMFCRNAIATDYYLSQNAQFSSFNFFVRLDHEQAVSYLSRKWEKISFHFSFSFSAEKYYYSQQQQKIWFVNEESPYKVYCVQNDRSCGNECGISLSGFEFNLFLLSLWLFHLPMKRLTNFKISNAVSPYVRLFSSSNHHSSVIFVLSSSPLSFFWQFVDWAYSTHTHHILPHRYFSFIRCSYSLLCAF